MEAAGARLIVTAAPDTWRDIVLGYRRRARRTHARADQPAQRLPRPGVGDTRRHTRIFKAPRARVFDAFADPERLARPATEKPALRVC
jgi:hypothetical protein